MIKWQVFMDEISNTHTLSLLLFRVFVFMKSSTLTHLMTISDMFN